MAEVKLALVLLFLLPCAAQVCQSKTDNKCTCKMADDVVDLSPVAEDIKERFGRVGWQTEQLDYTCFGQDMSLCQRLKGCMQTNGDGKEDSVRTNIVLNITPHGVELDRHEKTGPGVTSVRLMCAPSTAQQVPPLPEHGLWVYGRLGDGSCSLLRSLYRGANGQGVDSNTAPSPPTVSAPSFPTAATPPGVVTATASSPTIALLLLSTEVVLTALILVSVAGIALCALGMRKMKRRHIRRQVPCQSDPPPYIMCEKVPLSH